MFCHVIGEPFPNIEWLKNDEKINHTIHHEKYEIIGSGVSLKIKNIGYSDTGAYMCQASNFGGVVRDISSLIVQEEPQPTVQRNDEQKFVVFHEYGIAIYEPSNCRLHHQIRSTDKIPGSDEYVCGEKGPCSWGQTVNVGKHLIYVCQPNRDRVLVLSTVQMIIIDVIQTDSYPVELKYVQHLDQIWVVNWRSENDTDQKTIVVIRDANQKKKHYTVHPEPIDGQFDLVKGLFLPSSELEMKNLNFKYGYVTHGNQRGFFKLDLANFRYTKFVDLVLYNCVPDNIEFSALCKLLKINKL